MELSLEFFPPKTEEGAAKLRSVREQLSRALKPTFISVTFGAGGSTQDGTLSTVKEIHEAGQEAAPHLSCVGSSKEKIRELLKQYKEIGIRRIVDETMAAATRMHMAEKGRDPRRYAMVAFGGAGPAHAVRVARILGISEVLVPPASGAASALGFLAAPLAFETSRSLIMPLGAQADFSAVASALEALEAEARARLRVAGVADAAMRVERSAEMRMVGQLHQIMVPLPEGEINAARLPDIRERFIETYQRLYTRAIEGAEIELLSLRVRVVSPEPEISISGAVGVAAGYRG